MNPCCHRVACDSSLDGHGLWARFADDGHGDPDDPLAGCANVGNSVCAVGSRSDDGSGGDCESGGG